jgi:hypothetical protein
MIFWLIPSISMEKHMSHYWVNHCTGIEVHSLAHD